MVRGARVRPGPGAGDRGSALGDIPGVPAAAEAGQLLDRPGDGEADEPEKQQLAAATCVSEGDEHEAHRHEPPRPALDHGGTAYSVRSPSSKLCAGADCDAG